MSPRQTQQPVNTNVTLTSFINSVTTKLCGKKGPSPSKSSVKQVPVGNSSQPSGILVQCKQRGAAPLWQVLPRSKPPSAAASQASPRFTGGKLASRLLELFEENVNVHVTVKLQTVNGVLTAVELVDCGPTDRTKKTV